MSSLGANVPVSTPKRDPLVWDDWHPVAGMATLPIGGIRTTMLLDVPIAIARLDANDIAVWTDPGGRCRNNAPFERIAIGSQRPVIVRYGHVWTSLGEPARPLLGLTWALNYALAGTRPWPYHLVNLLIHAANAAIGNAPLVGSRMPTVRDCERRWISAATWNAATMISAPRYSRLSSTTNIRRGERARRFRMGQ